MQPNGSEPRFKSAALANLRDYQLIWHFAALHSERRREVLRVAHDALIASADLTLHDRLAAISELARCDCFATDGHWHKAATHDARHEGRKLAVGQFYSLDLRTHTLRRLAAGQDLHEHAMSALKRVTPRGLRQGVAKGRRVLLIHDKEGIDFNYWKRCRHECAVYFLSRVKDNMVYEWLACRLWDRADARNHGVRHDRSVQTREGHLLLLYEQELERRHGVSNQAEGRRRTQRAKQAEQTCATQQTPLATRVLQARRATQRSVKFIRWLRQSPRDNAAETTAILRLKTFDATS